MSHTPGPWRSGPNPHPRPDSNSNQVVVRPVGEFPHGRWVADCGSLNDPERLANARLIAAAPDMLAALKELAVRYDPHFPSGPLDRALAAIAKAEGRAP